mmetsp:Transcript_36998/g.92889  ORF Transcript_36998/g.92889 Transcript_36998/m.92889 type:complete len:87 (-) Transcript_36998:98-358(-)
MPQARVARSRINTVLAAHTHVDINGVHGFSPACLASARLVALSALFNVEQMHEEEETPESTTYATSKHQDVAPLGGQRYSRHSAVH